MIDYNSNTLDLVREASTGNRDSMEKLLELTRPRLFSYLMRLTMDYHLAEDLLQEVQMEIMQSLWRLNNASLFWPWIYKYTWGTVKHHYRDTRKHKAVYMSEMEQDFFEQQLSSFEKKEGSVYGNFDHEKMFETVYGAVKKLGLRQRNILAMRCFEDMSFYEISQFLECSETNARVLFFRARKKIKSHLRRKGFKANTAFVPALGLFGALTSKTASAGAPAAVTVSASSLEIGWGASMLGFLTTKLGLLCSSAASFALAWFTLAHLFIIGIVTVALIPLILITFFYMAFDD